MSAQATVVPGPILTRNTRVLAWLAGVAAFLVAVRFLVGIGPVTGLNDGYPWGLWIAFDVVTGTALACGGYAVALLVYVMNRGRYHPLVRPAVLTSALGYSMAAVTIMFDVGRPWWLFRIPIQVWDWNLNSALLEVALCVMVYLVVLWLELTPAMLERWKDDAQHPRLRALAARVTPVLDRGLLWLLALGLILPTMHQSSLGTVMLLTGDKLHRLWHTPLLPLLFLLSCLAMGYAAVVFEATLSSRAFDRRPETQVLSALARPTVISIALFLAIRLVDIVARGRLGLVFQPGLPMVMFLLELALSVAAIVMLMDRERTARLGHLFRAAIVVMVAGALYRVDTYLVAYDPGPNWSYFPAVPEMLITIGVLAAEVLAYVAFVKTFPVLGGAPARTR